jgi:predicted transcriptional regulator YdeE
MNMMIPEHLSLHDIHVVGLALRTKPERAAADIAQHWARFFAEGWPERLGITQHTPLYAVYCEYASDHRGAYTMILGACVADLAKALDSDKDASALRRITLVSGNYARFVAAGDPQDVVWRAWREINEAWSERATRRYVTDFERYAPGRPANDAHVEVCVGVK